MKESLKRIGVWVKAHPWLSAAIVGGVILVAWLVYRSGGGSSGDGSASSTAGELPTPSEITTPDYSGGEVSVPSNPISDFFTPAENDTSGTGGQAFDIPEMSGGDFVIPDYSGSYDSFAAALSPEMSPISGVASASIGKSLTTVPATILGTAQASLGKSVPVIPTIIPATIKVSVGGAPISIAAKGSASVANVNAGNLRPSQLVGKGKNFTGVYNGVRYAGGYVVGSVSQNNPMSVGMTSVSAATGKNKVNPFAGVSAIGSVGAK